MRLKLTVATAATAALVLGAGLVPAGASDLGTGAVKVLGNGFSSESGMKRLVRVRKSDNPACTRTFKSSGRMQVKIGGEVNNTKTKECAYDPLVLGGPDGTPGDNLEVTTSGKIADNGIQASRLQRAFMAVSIRDNDEGDVGWYLAAFPNDGRWEVWKRATHEGQCTIEGTGTTDVMGLGDDNELRFRLFESGIHATVNTTEVFTALSPGFTVDPERTAVVVGVSSGTPRTVGSTTGCPNVADGGGGKDVTGSFDDIRVGVPDPLPRGVPANPDPQGLGNSPSQGAPACPSSPCEAIGKLTGYQTKASSGGSTVSGPMSYDPDPSPGSDKVVAWRITLGDPNGTQKNFFNNFFGNDAKANLGTLSKVDGFKNRFRLRGKFQAVELSDFFGHRLTVAPGAAIDVRQDWKLALIIPTWAPAFDVGLNSNNAWRATREQGFTPPDKPAEDLPPKPPCTPGTDGVNFKNGEEHSTVDTTARYRCNYNTARLLYEALIARP